MTLKQILYILSAVILLMALSFLAGKQSAKSVDVKTTTTDNKLVDTHTTQVTTESKKKDGTLQIVVTTDTVQSTKDVRKTDVDTVVTNSPKWNVSGMVAEDLAKLSLSPTYGVSITHQFIGPVNIGAFGFTNGLIGLSIGISF